MSNKIKAINDVFTIGQMVRHKKTGKKYVVVCYDSRPEFYQERPKPGFTAARYTMGGTGKLYGPQRHMRDDLLEPV